MTPKPGQFVSLCEDPPPLARGIGSSQHRVPPPPHRLHSRAKAFSKLRLFYEAPSSSSSPTSSSESSSSWASDMASSSTGERRSRATARVALARQEGVKPPGCKPHPTPGVGTLPPSLSMAADQELALTCPARTTNRR